MAQLSKTANELNVNYRFSEQSRMILGTLTRIVCWSGGTNGFDATPADFYKNWFFYKCTAVVARVNLVTNTLVTTPWPLWHSGTHQLLSQLQPLLCNHYHVRHWWTPLNWPFRAKVVVPYCLPLLQPACLDSLNTYWRLWRFSQLKCAASVWLHWLLFWKQWQYYSLELLQLFYLEGPINAEWPWWKMDCGALWVVPKDYRIPPMPTNIQSLPQEGIGHLQLLFIGWTVTAELSLL